MKTQPKGSALRTGAAPFHPHWPTVSGCVCSWRFQHQMEQSFKMNAEIFGVRPCLCLVFPLHALLRHCLCLVFPLPLAQHRPAMHIPGI